MNTISLRSVFGAFAILLITVSISQSQTSLLAVGTLDTSAAGNFQDLSGLTYPLENGVRANELGGFGSAITNAGGYTFLALPDRGPNAVSYHSSIDDTASYINRFQTVTMDLSRNNSHTGLPCKLVPKLRQTTLLWSFTPLVYGSGSGLGVGSGAPPLNAFFFHFFTGRSDNFDPNKNSDNPADARFDTEGLRISNDGRRIYVSDEYGPTSTNSTASPGCVSAPSSFQRALRRHHHVSSSRISRRWGTAKSPATPKAASLTKGWKA